MITANHPLSANQKTNACSGRAAGGSGCLCLWRCRQPRALTPFSGAFRHRVQVHSSAPQPCAQSAPPPPAARRWQPNADGPPRAARTGTRCPREGARPRPWSRVAWRAAARARHCSAPSSAASKWLSRTRVVTYSAARATGGACPRRTSGSHGARRDELMRGK